MSNETPTPATPPPPPSTPVQPGRQSGLLGCLGRMTSALLVIIITTFLALLGVAAGALYLGYTPQTARDIGDAQQRLQQIDARNAQLEAQNSAMQTQIVQVMSQAGTDRETLDALSDEVQGFTQVREVVETQIAADSRERATLVASMSDSREAVEAFATAEAQRAETVLELQRRSERVERFLQRLSDIAGDTALDIASATPTPARDAGTATPTPSAEPTPTSAAPTETPGSERTPSPTP